MTKLDRKKECISFWPKLPKSIDKDDYKALSDEKIETGGSQQDYRKIC